MLFEILPNLIGPLYHHMFLSLSTLNRKIQEIESSGLYPAQTRLSHAPLTIKPLHSVIIKVYIYNYTNITSQSGIYRVVIDAGPTLFAHINTGGVVYCVRVLI